MGILDKIRTTKFRELPFRTKATTAAVRLGLVLILIMVLGADSCPTTAEQVPRTLTIEKQGEGTVTGAKTYYGGEVAEITATPADGWEFVSWSGGPVANPESSSTTVIDMDVNKTITAVFTQIQYTLTIETEGSGSAFSSGTYPAGEVVDIMTIPAPGWEFYSWSGDAVADTAKDSTTIIMDGDKVITANFSEIPPPQYDLIIMFSGSGSATGVNTYVEGTVAEITATPADGWEFVSWSGGPVANPSLASTTITMDGDKVITANFRLKISIGINRSAGINVGDAVGISIAGLTPGGAFTKTISFNDGSVTYNLTADANGNFEGSLIPETPGTYTVTIVDATTGSTAEVTFVVVAAS